MNQSIGIGFEYAHSAIQRSVCTNATFGAKRTLPCSASGSVLCEINPCTVGRLRICPYAPMSADRARYHLTARVGGGAACGAVGYSARRLRCGPSTDYCLVDAVVKEKPGARGAALSSPMAVGVEVLE